MALGSVQVRIGGTAEAFGGGKFAKGAVTGAYVMILIHFAMVIFGAGMMEIENIL